MLYEIVVGADGRMAMPSLYTQLIKREHFENCQKQQLEGRQSYHYLGVSIDGKLFEKLLGEKHSKVHAQVFQLGSV